MEFLLHPDLCFRVFGTHNCWVKFKASFDASLHDRQGRVHSILNTKLEGGAYEYAGQDSVWVSYRHNQTDHTKGIHVNDLYPALPSKSGEEVMVVLGDHTGRIGKVIKWGKKAKVAKVKIDDESFSFDFNTLIKIAPVEPGVP